MIRACFSKRESTSSCCSRWVFKLRTRPTATLIIFLIAYFGALPCTQTLAQDIEVVAELELKTGTRDGLLTVTANIPDGFHTYSLTQPVGGPTKSTLKINGTGIQLTRDFFAQQEPEKHDDELMGPMEELRGVVSWVARVQVSPEVDPAKLKAKIDLFAQVCTDLTEQCKPPTTYSGSIDFLGESADLELPTNPKQIKLNPFQPYNSHVLISGSVFSKDGAKNFKPGDTVTMQITAKPQDPFHFYAYQTKPQDSYTPTLISIKRPVGWTIAGPTASVKPTFEDDFPIHDAATSWRFEIKIPETAAPDQAVALTGGIQIQTCNQLGCDAPSDSIFIVTIPMGTDSVAALKFETATFGTVRKAVAKGDLAEPIGDGYAVARKPTSEPSRETIVERIEADTPDQIAAMAQLYDVNEPIKYIDFTEMNQFPVGPPDSEPIKQVPLLLALMLAFILGAMISLMVYMLFNRKIETEKTAKQEGDQPVYPRMRRIAFAACLFFSICIVANGVLLIADTVLRTTDDETNQSATAKTTGTITWANWHPGKVVQQLNQNKTVWVNYTADWDLTSKLNEVRVASNADLVKRMNEMNISFIAVDFTQRNENNRKELARTDTYSTPVNLIYPPNYPQQPAIKLETIFTPTDVHLVLDRMEAITSKMKK